MYISIGWRVGPAGESGVSGKFRDGPYIIAYHTREHTDWTTRATSEISPLANDCSGMHP